MKSVKLLEKNFKSKARKIAFSIGILILVSILALVFQEMELEHNRQLTVNNYRIMQEDIVKQAALRMESYFANETLDVNAIILKITSEVETTGRSYWFIAREQKLLFVKDEITTKQYVNTAFKAYISDNTIEEMQVSYYSFYVGDIEYTVGNCTNISYIEDLGQLFRHHIYTILSLVLISMLSLVILIYIIIILNKRDKEIAGLSSQIKEKNIMVEKLAKKHKEIIRKSSKVEPFIEHKENTVYSKEVFHSLLEKISNNRIHPVTIAVFEFSSENIDYGPNNFRFLFQEIPKKLEVDCVLSELSAEVFVLLLFHTVKEEKKEIQEMLISKWAMPLKKRGVNVRMGISSIENEETDIKEVFSSVYREVCEGRSYAL